MKMLKLLISFLILSGCALQPKHSDYKFDAEWKFCEYLPGEKMACLSVEDVKELRELLIRCESKDAGSGY